MTVDQRTQLLSSPSSWLSTFSYAQGDYVSRNRLIYVSLVGSNVNEIPSNGENSNWRLLSDSGLHLWRSTELYLSGGLVSHAGIIYRANTSVTPGQNAPNTNSNWTILETVANPGSTTTALTSIGVNGTNYALSATVTTPEFLLGTGNSGDTDLVRTGINLTGFTTNGYVKLYMPHVLTTTSHRAADVTFNSDKFVPTATLTTGSDFSKKNEICK